MNFKNLSTFALSDRLSDFGILLSIGQNKVRISAHRIVLAANSPSFFKLFGEDPKLDAVQMPVPVDSVCGSTTQEFFENVIRFCYGEQNLETLQALGLNETNAFRFYSVAMLLDLTTAIAIVTKFIEERNFTEANLMVSLLEAIKFGQEGWVFKLVQKTSHNIRKVFDNEEWTKRLISVPIDVIKAIVSRNDLNVVNEDSVFKLVLDYIRFREGLAQDPKEDYGPKPAVEEPKKDGKAELPKEAQKAPPKEAAPNKDAKTARLFTASADLEKEAEARLANFKLSPAQKSSLLNMVRLSYVSHTVLLESVRDPILSPFKDLILEAISAKLASYESVTANYSIPLQPRDSYSHKNPNIAPVKNLESVHEPPSPPAAELGDKPSTMSNSIGLPPKERKIEFTHVYDFDENGALFWLGTLGKKEPYRNPYAINQVKVFFSSIADKCKYDTFVGRSLENCRTLNSKNSFMGLDLGEKRTLIPKHYTIRNRDSTDYVMINWILEVSNNYNEWFEVDRRVHLTNMEDYNRSKQTEREKLIQKGALTTWTVDSNKVRESAKKMGEDWRKFKGFRFFRIKQISQNTQNSDNLGLSGIELYGSGYGDWFFD